MKKFLWQLYDWSGLRFIYEKKINPPIDKKTKKRIPRTIFLWFIGVYIAIFGVASNRYENRVDIIENRINAIYAQISKDITLAFKRINDVQNMTCPYKPEVYNPVSIIMSFLPLKNVTYQEGVEQLKQLVEDWAKKTETIGSRLQKEPQAEKWIKQLPGVMKNGKLDKSIEIGIIAGIDLISANLKNAKLYQANLENAFLLEANLKNAKLSDANLENAFLLEANLENADLYRANLKNAFLLEANLENAKLSDANLENADLEEANLENANLSDANLENAFLDDINLENAKLSDANLKNADLSDANLKNADLSEANLKNADLYRANLKNAVLSDANLENADLSEANLENAVLSDANLKNAVLSDANLENADLEEANLENADLSEANLKNANLLYANLIEAKFLTIEQLSKVKTLYETELDSNLLKQVKEKYPHLLEKPDYIK
jgi:uncharacterized protein YjbI with pentapeptide repeats